MKTLEQMRMRITAELRAEQRRMLEHRVETFDAADAVRTLRAQSPRAERGLITVDQVAAFIGGVRHTLEHYPDALPVALLDGHFMPKDRGNNGDRIELRRCSITCYRRPSTWSAPSWPFCGVRRPDSSLTEDDSRWRGIKHELARRGWSVVGGVWRPPGYGEQR